MQQEHFLKFESPLEVRFLVFQHADQVQEAPPAVAEKSEDQIQKMRVELFGDETRSGDLYEKVDQVTDPYGGKFSPHDFLENYRPLLEQDFKAYKQVLDYHIPLKYDKNYLDELLRMG